MEAKAVELDVLACRGVVHILKKNTVNILSYLNIRSFLFAPKKYEDAIVTTCSE